MDIDDFNNNDGDMPDNDDRQWYQSAFSASRELFGEMRGLTEEEAEAYHRMLSEHAVPLGINIFDLPDNIECVTVSLDDLQNAKTQKKKVPTIRYIFSGGHICRVISPDFGHNNDLAEEENNHSAKIISFETAREQYEMKRALMICESLGLPPEAAPIIRKTVFGEPQQSVVSKKIETDEELEEVLDMFNFPEDE